MSRARGLTCNVARARFATVAAVALLASVGDGCGRGTKADSTKAPAGASSPPGTASAGTGPAPACPRTGHWIACQVRYRIDRAGLTPHDTAGPQDLPALGPKPATYRIGKAVLVVYLFADSGSRSRARRQLDTTRFVADTQSLTIRSEATVIENDNLLALLFGKNEHQRERVSDALTAGPPQP